ncbi:MAG: tetrapyrrole methylase, partial [Neisseria sp.]|nr:tetrapyrrole methylase [Neisseria sp.]
MCSDGLRFFGVARMKPILYLIPTPLGAPDTPCLL